MGSKALILEFWADSPLNKEFSSGNTLNAALPIGPIEALTNKYITTVGVTSLFATTSIAYNIALRMKEVAPRRCVEVHIINGPNHSVIDIHNSEVAQAGRLIGCPKWLRDF